MARNSASPTLNPAVTEVNGRKIIAVEPATGSHPHPRQNGRIVPITGVSKVLLDDSTETHVCNACGWSHTDVKSVVGHMPSHTVNKKVHRYAPEVARLLVRLVREAEREHGHRGKCEVVARQLNDRGVTTLSGESWTAANVSHVYRKYADAYPGVGRRARAARPAADAPTSVPLAADVIEPPTTTPSTEDELAAVTAELDELWKTLRGLQDVVVSVSRRISRLPRPEPVDPSLESDARKWRQMVKFLGREPGAEG